MANKMPPELLEKFQKGRTEDSSSDGDKTKLDARKRARAKARKAKAARGNQG